MNKVFTYIVAFRGGIYVSQVDAADFGDSVERWFYEFTGTKPLGRLTEVFANRAKAQILSGSAVALSGVSGVWFFSGFYSRSHYIGHIIDTAVLRPPTGCEGQVS